MVKARFHLYNVVKPDSEVPHEHTTCSITQKLHYLLFYFCHIPAVLQCLMHVCQPFLFMNVYMGGDIIIILFFPYCLTVYTGSVLLNLESLYSCCKNI